MTAAMAMFPTMPFPERSIVVKKDASHLRKKCKSCKLFPCYDDRHKYRSSPLAQACQKYESR